MFKKDEDILISGRVDQLVSIHFPTELSVEPLRSLCTSFYFAMMKPKNKDLVISGYTLEMGKAFITNTLSVGYCQ